MNAKISQNGFLEIDRGMNGVPQWKTMMCPFTADGDGETRGYCGDWCPHFGTPFKEVTSPFRYIDMSICHGTVFAFDEFADNRP